MDKTSNVYIIHASDKEENYIDRTLQAEKKLMGEGHRVLNPLPDQQGHISNQKMHDMYGGRIRECDEVFVMDGYNKANVIGNAEFAEAMVHKKTIRFEQ